SGIPPDRSLPRCSTPLRRWSPVRASHREGVSARRVVSSCVEFNSFAARPVGVSNAPPSHPRVGVYLGYPYCQKMRTEKVSGVWPTIAWAQGAKAAQGKGGGEGNVQGKWRGAGERETRKAKWRVRNMNILQNVLSSTDERAALPPGPRMPSALQAAGWALRPLSFMERCEKRYGEIFTLRIRHGRPWVFLTNPEHVKQIFTTSP